VIEHVDESHLAGHAELRDSDSALLLIDSHDRPVANAVWDLYECVIADIGPTHTLIEWDSNLPAWPVLRAQATAAGRITERCAMQALAGLISAGVFTAIQPGV
jgi:uncharacterized protein (UPF0276 family)